VYRAWPNPPLARPPADGQHQATPDGYPVRLAKSTEASRSPRAVWKHAGMSIVPHRVPSPLAVRRAFREELSLSRRSATLSWLSSTATFVVCRLITHRIRDKNAKQNREGHQDQHHNGLHDLSIKGVHLHHYLWGILIARTGVMIRTCGWLSAG
jgi:hypothetical protein